MGAKARRVSRPAIAAAILPLMLGACVANGPTALAENAVPVPQTKPLDSTQALATTDVAMEAQAATPTTISGDAKIDRLIETYAEENHLPTDFAYAVVRVESHYNPKAKGVGVYGLSQIQPRTARSLGFSGPVEALYDPDTNLRYGMKYLAGAWERGDGDVCQAAMKYKAGHRSTVMSPASMAYCGAVKQHMAAIERRRVHMHEEVPRGFPQPGETLVASADGAPLSVTVASAAATPAGSAVAAVLPQAKAPAPANPALVALTSGPGAAGVPGAALAISQMILPASGPMVADRPASVSAGAGTPIADIVFRQAAPGEAPVGKTARLSTKSGRVVPSLALSYAAAR